jgi:hypothetical protein
MALCAGDGCNRFMGMGEVDLRTLVAADGGRTTLFESMGDAYADARAPPPSRAAFIFAADNTPSPLPCHISFLWREVDEAMASLLAPLLPLAKLLGTRSACRSTQRRAGLLLPPPPPLDGWLQRCCSRCGARFP